MKTADATQVLTYLTQLPEGAASGDAVLRQLAESFDAGGIGLAPLHGNLSDGLYAMRVGGLPDHQPWKQDPAILGQLRTTLSGLVIGDAAERWMLALGWDPRTSEPQVVWLYHRGPEVWSETEQALWPIVAQMLVRHVAPANIPLASYEETRRKLEQMAQITSRLTHDFGNYLTGMLGFTELSLAQVPPDGLAYRYLREVLESAQQGASWVRRLQWFCRRNGQFTWPTELSSVLNEVQSQSAAKPADDGAAGRRRQLPIVNWTRNIPPDLPLLALDAASLNIALTEVVNNALEATRKAVNITVTARIVNLTEADCRSLLGMARAGTHVEITISDDGPGFTAEARAKLFHEPFFSSKPRQRGLGLLVVYGIMHRFQGGIRLPTPPAGETGAHVQLYLPAVLLEAPTRTTRDSAHLLLVEPEPQLVQSLRKVLEGHGYRVTVVANAQAAINAYQAPGESFALVVTETMLPSLSGFDLARRVLERDPKARFLFLHSHSSFHGLSEGEMLKRFNLLRWPIEPAVLVQAVQAEVKTQK